MVGASKSYLRKFSWDVNFGILQDGRPYDRYQWSYVQIALYLGNQFG